MLNLLKEGFRYLDRQRLRWRRRFKTGYGVAIQPDHIGNRIIADALRSDAPFLASRLGATELAAVNNYLEIQRSESVNGRLARLLCEVRDQANTWRPQIRLRMPLLSGFFPADDENLEQFARLYLDCLRETDLFGVWYLPGEAEVIRDFAPKARLTHLKGLEPYYYAEPWSRVLAARRVLVVHPFAESIERQYRKRHALFSDSSVLPEFELQTLPAVQSIGGRHSRYASWFEALDDMRQQINARQFDVAIVACGRLRAPLGGAHQTNGPAGDPPRWRNPDPVWHQR